jgi:hypothetical protein
LPIPQAQDLVNANRPKELDPVTVSELIGFPHDEGDLRVIAERVGGLILPQIVARGDVFKQGRYVGSKRTRIHDGEVVTFDNWSRPYFSFQGAQPIDDEEKARLRRALDAFAVDALDVNRGPQRWSRYLPPDLRDFDLVSQLQMPERNSNAALSMAVTTFLDSSVLWPLWIALERPRDYMRFWDDLERSAPESSEALDKLLNPYRQQVAAALRTLPQVHRQRDVRFLTEVLVGSRWKAQKGELKGSQFARLPDSQPLYWVQFSLNLLFLFEWSGDSLRLVNVVGVSN